VLSRRIRIVQAARLRRDLVDRHGNDGAFPAPKVLGTLDLDLPVRKTEYLHAVAGAALDGRLDGTALRALDPDDAIRSVQQIKGLGPFAAELVVLRGANAPGVLPRNERRLDEGIVERYGTDRTLAQVSQAWPPIAWVRCSRSAQVNGGPGAVGTIERPLTPPVYNASSTECDPVRQPDASHGTACRRGRRSPFPYRTRAPSRCSRWTGHLAPREPPSERRRSRRSSHRRRPRVSTHPYLERRGQLRLDLAPVTVRWSHSSLEPRGQLGLTFSAADHYLQGSFGALMIPTLDAFIRGRPGPGAG